jgi:hypothetical protein
VTAPSPRLNVAAGFGPGLGVLLAASVGFSLLVAIPLALGLVLAVVGPVVGALVRMAVPRRFRASGLVPPLAVLGTFASLSPVGVLPELAAGVTGLALLLWYAEDPDRYPGAILRGLGGLVAPAAVLAIALASSLLLPAGVGSLGIAAGLLAATIAAIALLLGAPHLFDEAPPTTS